VQFATSCETVEAQRVGRKPNRLAADPDLGPSHAAECVLVTEFDVSGDSVRVFCKQRRGSRVANDYGLRSGVRQDGHLAGDPVERGWDPPAAWLSKGLPGVAPNRPGVSPGEVRCPSEGVPPASQGEGVESPLARGRVWREGVTRALADWHGVHVRRVFQATEVPAYDLRRVRLSSGDVKTARVYAEIAAFARANGYAAVTEHAVHDWRTNAMLPSARGLGRTRRAPGRLPRGLRDRALEICRYRYQGRIRDLKTITLLLWLDGADIAPEAVRRALTAIRLIPHRVVRAVGHPSLRAEPGADEADLDASAEAVGRALASGTATEFVPQDDLVNAARDALRLATGRGAPEAVEDLAPIAKALGLERAHTETLEGAGPWLEEDPAVGFAAALVGLYGMDAKRRIEQSTDDVLADARRIANRLAMTFGAYAEMSLAFPPGAAGLALLMPAAGGPDQRVLLAYVAVLEPAPSRLLADAFTDEDLAGWRSDAAAGRAWLDSNPQHRADAQKRGLLAVLRDQGYA
jgi:hypothetical protein